MPLGHPGFFKAGFILVVVAGAVIMTWHRRRVVRRAVPALTSVEKLTSSLLVGRFGEHRCRIEFHPGRRESVAKLDSSFLLITVGSGSTVPFRAFRQHPFPFVKGPVAYESARPERLEEIRHSGDIEPLLESLLETADSVEVEGRVSVRFCPYNEAYVEPYTLEAILNKVAALATALDNEAVRAGASRVDIDRSRSQLEARLA
jgi:hypothetical protein